MKPISITAGDRKSVAWRFHYPTIAPLSDVDWTARAHIAAAPGAAKLTEWDITITVENGPTVDDSVLVVTGALTSSQTRALPSSCETDVELSYQTGEPVTYGRRKIAVTQDVTQ